MYSKCALESVLLSVHMKCTFNVYHFMYFIKCTLLAHLIMLSNCAIKNVLLVYSKCAFDSVLFSGHMKCTFVVYHFMYFFKCTLLAH